mmetsp:Transcript_39974/g.64907  ORF Transcript_39974/g.64907 Transcript_39974/m.64907 type:complete len:88 (+) Transcript_39974:3543-3806(+)
MTSGQVLSHPVFVFFLGGGSIKDAAQCTMQHNRCALPCLHMTCLLAEIRYGGNVMRGGQLQFSAPIIFTGFCNHAKGAHSCACLVVP